jgi:recombination protein RecA
VETETSLESFAAGLQTAVLGRNLRRIASAAMRTGTCVLFLNQLRSSRAGDFAETTPGGRVLKAWAAIRCELRPFGRGRVHLRVVKNKFAPRVTTDVEIPFEEPWTERAGASAEAGE